MDDERQDSLREEERRQAPIPFREKLWSSYGRAAEPTAARLVSYAVILVVLIGAAIWLLGR